MDSLIDYPDFVQDIKDSFSNLIKEFDLKFWKARGGCYLLLGDKCNIRFTYDRGDVFCEIKEHHDILDKMGYGVVELAKYLNEGVEIERIYDPRLQLFEYSKIAEMYLKDVLNGDFSWKDDYLKKEDQLLKKESRISKLYTYLTNNFSSQNSIYEKLKTGDLTWQQDLEQYLKDNNINL